MLSRLTRTHPAPDQIPPHPHTPPHRNPQHPHTLPTPSTPPATPARLTPAPPTPPRRAPSRDPRPPTQQTRHTRTHAPPRQARALRATTPTNPAAHTCAPPPRRAPQSPHSRPTSSDSPAAPPTPHLTRSAEIRDTQCSPLPRGSRRSHISRSPAPAGPRHLRASPHRVRRDPRCGGARSTCPDRQRRPRGVVPGASTARTGAGGGGRPALCVRTGLSGPFGSG